MAALPAYSSNNSNKLYLRRSLRSPLVTSFRAGDSPDLALLNAFKYTAMSGGLHADSPLVPAENCDG